MAGLWHGSPFMIASHPWGSPYHVGGCLPPATTTYVQREADEALFQALRSGEFCYVFNARQMGKSSLRIRTMERLRRAGIQCVSIDLSSLGTHSVTLEQWYGAIAAFVAKQVELSFPFAQWWQAHDFLPVISRLAEFWDRLLQEVNCPIVVLIDEIDTILSLSFSADDFFALIRTCYNRRAENAAYERLTFALFGVTTPSALIADRTRTPFNLGRAIALRGFCWSEMVPLISGLRPHCEDPEATLRRIFEWTGGQPFLTQKLCHLVVQNSLRMTWQETGDPSPISPVHWVDFLVQTHVLENWEVQDEPEHLKTIRDRLLFNEQRAARLLGLYQRILMRSPEAIGQASNGEILIKISEETLQSQDQTELLLSGLIEKSRDGLRVKNSIYQAVFDLDWVARQLAQLRPYAQALNAWMVSGYQDESRLLRGQALQDLLHWSQGKSLADVDYRFLAASQACDRREMQARLENERLQEIEVRLNLERQRTVEQRRSLRRQRVMLGLVTGTMMIVLGLGVVVSWQYQRSAVREIQALAAAAKSSYEANQRLDALVQAIQARSQFLRLGWALFARRDALDQQTRAILEKSYQGADEFNRLTGHRGGVLGVDYSPDGRWIVTSGTDRLVKLWHRNGSLAQTFALEIAGHDVRISPDSRQIAVAGLDGTVTLWDIETRKRLLLKGHTSAVWRVAYSPDGQLLASASSDRTVRIWDTRGRAIAVLAADNVPVWSVVFSPDSQRLLSASVDGTIRIWDRKGSLLQTLQVSQFAIWSLAYSPDGQSFVSGSADGLVRLWDANGKLLREMRGHTGEVHNVAFSPDGRIIASAGPDRTINLWRPDGTLLRTFRGHRATIKAIAFSPDSQALASASEDNSVRMWRVRSSIAKPLYGHPSIVWRVVSLKGDRSATPSEPELVSVGGQEIKFWRLDGSLLKTHKLRTAVATVAASQPDGQFVAVGTSDGTIEIWSTQGTRVQELNKHQSAVYGLVYHPTAPFLISGGDDRALRLWERLPSGAFVLRQVLPAHPSRLWDVAISPSGQFVLSASIDGTVKLWPWDPKKRRLAEQPAQVFVGHNSAVWGVAVSPDSQYIASTGRDDSLRLWHRDGQLKRVFKGDGFGLTRVAFSPDGQMLAAAGVDGVVHLWSIDGKKLASLSGHVSNVTTVTFSPDGQLLISGSDDQTVILWDLKSLLNLNLLQSSCAWVTDYLDTQNPPGPRSLCP